MSVSIRLQPDRAVATYEAPVEAATIRQLCDAIDHALQHHYYEDVTIRIASPGGDIRALRYYQQQVRCWQRSGVVIATEALTECSSAAALMLSLGSRGHRKAALAYCRLVYHSVRMSPEALFRRESARLQGGMTARDGGVLARQLADMEGRLQREDDYQLDALLGHLYGATEPDAWFGAAYRQRRQFLAERLEALIDAGGRQAPGWDEADVRELRKTVAAIYGEPVSVEQAPARLARALRALMARDRAVTPLLAWVLMLIDDYGDYDD